MKLIEAPPSVSEVEPDTLAEAVPVSVAFIPDIVSEPIVACTVALPPETVTDWFPVAVTLLVPEIVTSLALTVALLDAALAVSWPLDEVIETSLVTVAVSFPCTVIVVSFEVVVPSVALLVSMSSGVMVTLLVPWFPWQVMASPVESSTTVIVTGSEAVGSLNFSVTCPCWSVSFTHSVATRVLKTLTCDGSSVLVCTSVGTSPVCQKQPLQIGQPRIAALELDPDVGAHGRHREEADVAPAKGAQGRAQTCASPSAWGAVTCSGPWARVLVALRPCRGICRRTAPRYAAPGRS